MAEEYFDVVLLGRTGQGRTTLASKLLDANNTDPVITKVLESRTDTKCKLTSNEVNKVLVVDVPGFSESDFELGTLQSNEQIIINLGQVLEEFQLHVKRVVYFLPTRGPLEKADGSLQEELKLLNHYFGREIFDRMVVVATQPPQPKYQGIGFDEEDLKQTSYAFQTALKNAVGDDMAYLHIVYNSLNDSPEETLDTIRNTSVINDEVPLRIVKDVGPFSEVDSKTDDFIVVNRVPIEHVPIEHVPIERVPIEDGQAVGYNIIIYRLLSECFNFILQLYNVVRNRWN